MERIPPGVIHRLWTDLPLRGKGFAVVGLPIAALFASLLLLSSTARREENAQAWLDHTKLVRDRVVTLTNDLLEAENSARGFVILPREDFLSELKAARARTEDQLKELRDLVQDNAAQSSRLSQVRDLMAKKWKAFDRLVSEKQAHPEAAPDQRLLDSYEAMQPLRAALLSMDAEEARLEHFRLTRLQEIREEVTAVTAVSLGLGLFGGLAAAMLFGKSIARRVEILRLNARALRLEAPLLPQAKARDEIGEVENELQVTSMMLVERGDKLRRSEAQLRTVIDNTTAVIYIKDLQSRLTLVNRRYEEVFGNPSASLLGKEPREIFAPELAERILENDQRVIRSGQAHQFEEVVMEHGEERIFLSVKVPLFDSEGKAYGLCGISTDITERKRAAEQLEQTGAKLQENVEECSEKLEEAEERLRAKEEEEPPSSR